MVLMIDMASMHTADAAAGSPRAAVASGSHCMVLSGTLYEEASDTRGDILLQRYFPQKSCREPPLILKRGGIAS